MSKTNVSNGYLLRDTGRTPFFYHVAMLTEIYKAAKTGDLYTYHFNILRSILEKTASFHGFQDFSVCIKQDKDDPDRTLHKRRIGLLNHGNYSLFEPRPMQEENKDHFRKILADFMESYTFNPELFPEETEVV